MAFAILFTVTVLSAADLTLWYQQPATDWITQALPIGNGHLAAMIFGRIPQEHIQFNEESLWIGDEQDTGAYQAFGDVFVEFNHADGGFEVDIEWQDGRLTSAKVRSLLGNPATVRYGRETRKIQVQRSEEFLWK